MLRFKYNVFFGSKQTNLSNQAIVQSKIDLTLCIWNDEYSTIVLEQD